LIVFFLLPYYFYPVYKTPEKYLERPAMERSEILIKLEKYKKTNQEKYRFSKIGVFGSIAKGTAGEQSDIDIVIEQKEPDLFLLGTIKMDLEHEFNRKVDIIRIRKDMNAFLRNKITQEAIYV
jgi:predicted nucleotidyltransferase